MALDELNKTKQNHNRQLLVFNPQTVYILVKEIIV